MLVSHYNQTLVNSLSGARRATRCQEMSQSKIHNDIYVPSQTWTYHNQEASEEEFKASYDDDIIDTYASRTVNLPASQTTLPPHDQYLSSLPHPRNSPLSPKSNQQVLRESTNEEFVLRPVDAREGQPRGFWASVSNLHNICRYLHSDSFLSFIRIPWPVDYMF